MSFQKLNIDLDVLPELQQFVTNEATWKDMNDRQFIQVPVPESIISKSAVLTTLKNLTDVHESFTLLKVDPWIFCHWHTDTYRNSAINCLIQGGWGSSTFFLPKGKRNKQSELTELHYQQLGSMYALDVQVPHSVVNRDYTRYALTLGFTCKYPELINLLKGLNYISK